MGIRLVSPLAFALYAFAFLIIGGIAGYIVATWLFRRERHAIRNDWLELAANHEDHARRLEQEDTRLGVNTGIEFATHQMRQTLDSLQEHVIDTERRA